MFKKLFGKEKAITNEKIVSPVTGVLLRLKKFQTQYLLKK